MALKFDVPTRNALLDALADRIGSGGILRIYSGTRPAAVATAPDGGNTVLAELEMGSPVAPAASGGVLTMNAISQDNAADATGTASWFRVFQSNGTTAILDGDVGTSGTDMILNTTSIVIGGPVIINSFTITAPGA